MISVPAWLTRDVQRRARWLPANIKQSGIETAFEQRWLSLAPDIQALIAGMDIPSWMIALVPTDPAKQPEIEKQFRFMEGFAGNPPDGQIATRAETLMLFGGAAQMPTPGDVNTGASLGAEGCTAAMAKYVIAQLKVEFPQELAGMSNGLTSTQLSTEMLRLFQQAANAGLVEIESRAFAQLAPGDVLPGSLMIAQKPGGTHVFGWTRVFAGWNWDPSDKMAIGNTGLPQFGDRMILAQEFVTGRPDLPGELAHNQHGPIYSHNVVMKNGRPDLTDPRTNPYAVKGANFVMVRFLDPTAMV